MGGGGGGGQHSLKYLHPSTFNKDLPNETIVSLNHLAEQNL